MIIILVITLMAWIIPIFLGLSSIYKQLPTDSTLNDLLDWCYGLGYWCLVPFAGYIVWIDNLKFSKIEMILNKKIK